MRQEDIGADTGAIDQHNHVFQHAVAFINQTNQSLFLTGKAGTGKTTFLRYIRTHSHKKMAVAAPTGVAAMNAGGMTLHALFWLPFGTFIPQDLEAHEWDSGAAIFDKRRLFSQLKLTARKRALLREIELLVIDEVSMLRADTLDAIDLILKSVRRDARAFGGLQVLFIGDLYQLPPVIKEEEWRVLAAFYRSPFFFEAHVLQQDPPVILELEKIYRQKDPRFITLLNDIRHNTCSTEQLAQLNTYYQPDFEPPAGDPYITLTTHNRRADEMNRKELQLLPGKSTTFSARVKGDFSASMFPADTDLTLKVGAQVMFIRNDNGEDRRYYNGKIGHVKHMDSSGDSILVGFSDGSESVEVKRETWENIRYDYDKGGDQIKEDVLGTFSQFPLRLAWAITIHKSQGLTFEKAIIDAGASFAAGQVYVALSRMTGLEGLVLKTPIQAHNIRTDSVVLDFSSRTAKTAELPDILEASQRRYLGQILLESFRWKSLTDTTSTLLSELQNRSIPQKDIAQQTLKAIALAVEAQEEVASKFRGQLQQLLRTGIDTDYELILDRTMKAVQWFGPRLEDHVIHVLENHAQEWAEKKRTKRYVNDLETALLEFKRKRDQLNQCLDIAENLTKTVSS